MELPKNVKQIGESDKNCKIYVEDYVISYVKQMNQLALNKEMAVSLYGLRKSEGNVTYLFVYGAAKLDFLQREVRHLSQAQGQEVEKLRRIHFPEQEFLGYCLLNGEMVEGFYICEQEICRYVTGYAQFYEKNDSMLAYMLETRTEQADPEVVDSEKYDVVKKRQEERRAEQGRENVSKKKISARQAAALRQNTAAVTPSRSMRSMQVATVGVFGLLCLIGVASLGDGKTAEELQTAARQAMSSLTEQKIPDAEDASVLKDTLVAEDKLTEALQQENKSQEAAENASGALQPTETSSGLSGAAQTENAAGLSGAAQTENAAGLSGAAQTENAAGLSGAAQTENAAGLSGAAQTNSTDVSQTMPAEHIPEASQTIQQESAGMSGQTAVPQPETQAEANTAIVPETTQTAVPSPVSYTIKQGDTLIGIALRNYGSDTKVSEICALNNISDPDNIQAGQKILLP